jgi:hypothetical protein
MITSDDSVLDVCCRWGFAILQAVRILLLTHHNHVSYFCCRAGSVCLDVINQTWSPLFGEFFAAGVLVLLSETGTEVHVHVLDVETHVSDACRADQCI